MTLWLQLTTRKPRHAHDLATRICDVVYGRTHTVRPKPESMYPNSFTIGDHNDVWLHNKTSDPKIWELHFRYAQSCSPELRGYLKEALDLAGLAEI